MSEPKTRARTYVTVVQAPEGYPADSELRTMEETPAAPVVHAVVLLSDHEKLEAEGSKARRGAASTWREASNMAEPTMRELWLEVDDALDDLPRFMAVTNQSKEGWLPGSEDAPSMETCVSVDDVRRLLRAKLRDRGAGSTGGETHGED